MPRSTHSLRPYSCFDFSGGLDIKSSPMKLAISKKQHWLTKAYNVVLTESGGVRTRGIRGDMFAPNSPFSGAVTGGIHFQTSTGVNQVVIGTDDGDLYFTDLAVFPTPDSQTITTALTAGRQWSFAIYNDLLICCNGADAPRTWDGTTLSTLGGTPPTGQIVCVHSNRVFMIPANSSTLYWSALNNEADWTTAGNAGNVEVDPQNGYPLTAMVSASGGAQGAELILTKSNAVYRLQGTAPATYAITDVKPSKVSAGAVGLNGICYALNDVWMVARDGIHTLSGTQVYGDLVEKIVSWPVEPYFRAGGAVLTDLDKAAIVYDRHNSRILVGISTDGDGNNIILVYDLGQQAWTVWEGELANGSPDRPGGTANALWVVLHPNTGVENVWAGGDGYVTALYDDQTDTDETFLEAEFRHISALGEVGLEKSARHLFVYVEESGNYNLTVTTRYDFGSSGGQTFTLSLLGNSHTLGVNWVLGTDPLGAESSLVRRCDLNGKGEFLELAFGGTLAAIRPWSVLGYEVFWRPRRAIRRGGQDIS